MYVQIIFVIKYFHHNNKYQRLGLGIHFCLYQGKWGRGKSVAGRPLKLPWMQTVSFFMTLLVLLLLPVHLLNSLTSLGNLEYSHKDSSSGASSRLQSGPHGLSNRVFPKIYNSSSNGWGLSAQLGEGWFLKQTKKNQKLRVLKKNQNIKKKKKVL